MRLPEVERGDSRRTRFLFRTISTASRVRFPDAARVAFYHRGFLGDAMTSWSQATMRGPSGWSIGERELMAAMVARWNSSTFCIGAHTATAAAALSDELVDAVADDYLSAPVSERLRGTLAFLEKLVRTPLEISTADAISAMRAGASKDDLRDAAAVAALFDAVNRYADALGFQVPSAEDFAKLAPNLLKRGYRS